MFKPMKSLLAITISIAAGASVNASAQLKTSSLSAGSLTTTKELSANYLTTSSNLTRISTSTKVVTTAPSNNELSPYEDPYNMIFSAEFTPEKPGKVSIKRLSSDAFNDKPFKRNKPITDKERTPERIHPVLVDWLNTRDLSDEETLILTFKENINIPRFPNPNENLPRDSEENQQVMKQTQAMINELKSQRRKTQGRLMEELQGRYAAETIDNFWLINSLVVKMPLKNVKAILGEKSNLLYIEPESGGEKPPAKEVKDGRQVIVSDPYFNLGQTSGYIGLLDTGMRFTHTQFNSPSNIDFRYDCTDGVCNNVPDITDDCWNHGTSTAAIISGNNNLGNLYRGVTGITLDSFKVYPAGCGGLSGTATVKAFEKAIAILDRVIVAEMQGGGGMNSSISTAADNAFDAGAVIIAANGNNGSSSGTVNAPANAHRVLGVGNFDVASGNQVSSQSRGPTSDNRIKPDIQAPTNTKTASNASDTATRSFGGTSGATPYASGAAALMRNWLRGGTGSIDPGQVYSHLILSGQQPYPFNNTSGAGKIKMPTGGHGYWGKTSIGNGTTLDIPIYVGSGKTKIEGALWWPETSGQSHNDVDLYLISPSGTMMDYSISTPSVFERARVSGELATGTWKVRIRGYSVPTGAQTVYWGARVR